jgi:hypothetical protein
MTRSIIVLNVPVDTSDDLLSLYFDNPTRSGGVDVVSCRREDAHVIVTFASHKSTNNFCVLIHEMFIIQNVAVP